jgi:hypothetical protein
MADGHGNDGTDRLWCKRRSGAEPGVIAVVGAILYVFPPTSIVGPILLTGYFGGAMMLHLQIGSPPVSHILLGFYLGLMVWGGLWLCHKNLRAVMPLRN